MVVQTNVQAGCKTMPMAIPKETSQQHVCGGDWQAMHFIQQLLKTVGSFFAQLQLLFPLKERQRGHTDPSLEGGVVY